MQGETILRILPYVALAGLLAAGPPAAARSLLALVLGWATVAVSLDLLALLLRGGVDPAPGRQPPAGRHPVPRILPVSADLFVVAGLAWAAATLVAGVPGPLLVAALLFGLGRMLGFLVEAWPGGQDDAPWSSRLLPPPVLAAGAALGAGLLLASADRFAATSTPLLLATGVPLIQWWTTRRLHRLGPLAGRSGRDGSPDRPRRWLGIAMVGLPLQAAVVLACIHGPPWAVISASVPRFVAFALGNLLLGMFTLALLASLPRRLPSRGEGPGASNVPLLGPVVLVSMGLVDRALGGSLLVPSLVLAVLFLPPWLESRHPALGADDGRLPE